MPADVALSLFWGSGIALLYTYAGYPSLLWLATRWFGRALYEEDATLALSVIVAARNEERHIAHKVRSVLEQDYPRERLECLVVSDGSTDGTEDRVRQLDDRRVRLLVQAEHRGKNAALNRAVAVCEGEVIVFTDANAVLGPGALRRLTRAFADPAVGLVTGRGLYGTGPDAAGISNAYVRYESLLKRWESRLGYVAYADGALYAMRRRLFRTLPATHVHDLVHPIDVALAGGRSVFQPDAFTVEPATPHSTQEYARQVRMVTQGMRVVALQAALLLRRGLLWPLWVLVSHRVLRWMTGPLLAAALGATVALAPRDQAYAAALAAQGLFYTLAIAGAIGERCGLQLGLARAPYYFCLVSVAAVAGLVQVARGRTYAAWDRTGGEAGA